MKICRKFREFVCRYTSCLLLFAVVFCACSRQAEYDRQLAAAESVIEHNADSALLLLSTIPDVLKRGTEASRALYDLLCTEALYKLDRDNPDSLLPVISRSKHFFASNGDQLRLERSTYYHAMLCYYHDDHDSAVVLLKEGERLALQQRDTTFLSKYYESLCMVNDRSGNYTLMLNYARSFLSLALIEGDASNIARACSEVSGAFSCMGIIDSANIYMLRIQPYIESVTDSSQRANLMTNVAIAYKEIGNLKSAKEMLLESQKYKNRANTEKVLGDICASEGDTLAALTHWEKSSSTDNLQLKISALESVLQHCIKYAQPERAMHILYQVKTLQDSLLISSEQKVTAELQMKYDQEVLKNKHQEQVNKAQKTIILLIVMLLAVTLFFKYKQAIFRKTIYSDQLEIRRKMELISRLTDEGRVKDEEIKHRKELVNGYERKVRELQHIKNELENSINLSNKTKKLEYDKMLQRFSKGKQVYDSVCQFLKLPQQDKDNEPCFVEYYFLLNYSSYQRWNEQYKALPTRSYTYLILNEMNYSDDQISEILCVKPATIRSIKSRLRARKR